MNNPHEEPQSAPEITLPMTQFPIDEAVKLLSEQSRQMAEEIKNFNIRYRQTQEEIQRGIRRTSGRII